MQRMLPFGDDRTQRAEHERALFDRGMRDGERGVGPGAARPEQDIEVERSCTPALAGAAAEARLEG